MNARTLGAFPVALAGLLVAGCSTGRGPSQPTQDRPIVTASAPSPHVPLPLAAPPPLPPPAPIPVDIVLDADALGEAEAGFVMSRIDDGLLVVKNVPATAFLVTKKGRSPHCPICSRGCIPP